MLAPGPRECRNNIRHWLARPRRHPSFRHRHRRAVLERCGEVGFLDHMLRSDLPRAQPPRADPASDCFWIASCAPRSFRDSQHSRSMLQHAWNDRFGVGRPSRLVARAKVDSRGPRRNRRSYRRCDRPTPSGRRAAQQRFGLGRDEGPEELGSMPIRSSEPWSNRAGSRTVTRLGSVPGARSSHHRAPGSGFLIAALHWRKGMNVRPLSDDDARRRGAGRAGR